MKSNAVKCYGTLGTCRIHLRAVFNNKQLVDTESHYAAHPYITFQCVHISHFTFHLSSLPFAIWTVNLLPNGGLHSPSAVHISNRALLRNSAYICNAERGLCINSTLAAYNTLSLLCTCSLKRSKLSIISRASRPRREANAL